MLKEHNRAAFADFGADTKEVFGIEFATKITCKLSRFTRTIPPILKT
jgi:hypothetical protein